MGKLVSPSGRLSSLLYHISLLWDTCILEVECSGSQALLFPTYPLHGFVAHSSQMTPNAPHHLSELVCAPIQSYAML